MHQHRGIEREASGACLTGCSGDPRWWHALIYVPWDKRNNAIEPPFGNPATSERPVALRPRLATGLPFRGALHQYHALEKGNKYNQWYVGGEYSQTLMNLARAKARQAARRFDRSPLKNPRFWFIGFTERPGRRSWRRAGGEAPETVGGGSRGLRNTPTSSYDKTHPD
jgi:hypothetical protein